MTTFSPSQTKKKLAATGQAKLRVRVTFSPVGGTAKAKSRSLKLIQR
jgi:hypothetical protein